MQVFNVHPFDLTEIHLVEQIYDRVIHILTKYLVELLHICQIIYVLQ